MSMFKAGKAVGQGVKYLTKLGSKIGKGLGSRVDKLGAGTRNTQAAAIKGVRGVRDAAANAGAAARRGVSDARRGYAVGRQELVNGDIMPKKSIGGKKLPSLGEWMNTKGKGMIRNPMSMPGNKPDKYMTKPDKYMNDSFNYKIGRRISDDAFAKSQSRPGMSKNRRAGIITGGAIAAGYGAHKANSALQNHYRSQKNAARGGM